MGEKSKIRTFRKSKSTEKVAWFFLLFLVFVLAGISYWRYTEYQEKQKIISIFDHTISRYREDLKDEAKGITGFDLHFLPEDLSIISYKRKQSPESYKQQLKVLFSKALDIYNKNEKSNSPFRVELDIGSVIKKLSIPEKIAQMFIFSLSGTRLEETEKEFLESSKVGGIILMGENIGTDEDVVGLTREIQQTNKKIPLFIAIDQEGGTVKRIQEDLPSQSEVMVKNVCDTYQRRGEILEKLGVNLNFGIVADMTEDKASFIYPRVFHKETHKLVTEAVRCTTATLSTIKHFPGHGAVKGNTHLGVQTIYKNCKDMEREDMTLFSSGFLAGVDLVMMGHLLLPCKDNDLPATLSPAHIKTVRDMGFHGLIITDDMHMIDTNFEWKKALKLGLLAGEDMLLYVDKTSRRQEVLDYAQELYHENILTEEMIDAHLQRIFEAKNKMIKRGSYIHKIFYKW